MKYILVNKAAMVRIKATNGSVVKNIHVGPTPPESRWVIFAKVLVVPVLLAIVAGVLRHCLP